MSKIGFTRESRTTSLKEFTPNAERFGGLCAGAIINFSVGEADFTTSKSEFWTGYKVPRLSIQIESRLDPDGVKKAYYQESFMPPAWTPDLLPDGRLKFILPSAESKLGHMLEAIKGSFADDTAWSDEDMAMLTTGLELTGEDGIFISREPEEIIAAYKAFYDNIVKIVEGADGKPAYRDANGLPKVYWLKLLYTVKGAPVNRGKLGFPNYADTGFIEEIVNVGGQPVQPSIKIQINKQESIDPASVKTKETPKPNMGGGALPQGATPGNDPAASNSAVPDWMK